MRIRPVNDHGRILTGDTPWGRFRVEWDAGGNLVSHEIEIRTPISAAAPTHAENPCTTGPGALLKRAIQTMTGDTPGPGCACNRRCKKMNDWGWWGCWRNRDTIAGWLVEEAAKRGHTVTPSAAMTLLRAAVKEARSPRTRTAQR